MKKWIRFVVLAILFFLLILVRAYQNYFFYDPLYQYFKNDYLYLSFPDVNNFKLFISYFLRYSVNSIISLMILKIAFKNHSYIKTITIFYVLAFVFLSSVFFGLLVFNIDIGYLFPFYIRRFMIQPVFVIVIMPFIYLLRKR